MPVAVFVGTLIGRDPHGRLRILLEFPDRSVLFRAGLVARGHAPHRPVHETDFGLVLVAAWPRTSRPAETEYRQTRSNTMMQHRVVARVRLARYSFVQRLQTVRGLRAELVELAEYSAGSEIEAIAADSAFCFDADADADAAREVSGADADADADDENDKSDDARAGTSTDTSAETGTTWLASLRAGD